MAGRRDPWRGLSGDQEARVQAALKQHHETLVRGLDLYKARTPLDELIEQEEAELGVGDDDAATMRAADEWALRCEGYRACLEDLLQDGLHPLKVVRVFLALCKIFKIPPVEELSDTVLGELGLDGRRGQGRAAVGARIRRIYNRRMEEAGFRNPQLSFQKSPTVRERLSEALQGNTNRRGSRSHSH